MALDVCLLGRLLERLVWVWAGSGVKVLVGLRMLRKQPKRAEREEPPLPPPVRKRVVVVGAGPSGLAAAQALVQVAQELDVVVLEARDRVGGRVNTVTLGEETDAEALLIFKRFTTGDGSRVDLGASYIHGCNGEVSPSHGIGV